MIAINNVKNVGQPTTWEEITTWPGWESAPDTLPARPYIVDPDPIGEQVTVGPKYTLIARTHRIYEAIRGGIDEIIDNIKGKPKRRRVIDCTDTEVHQITEEVFRYLDDDRIFVRADKVSRLRPNDEHQPVIETLNDPMLRGLLVRKLQFIERDKNNKVHKVPPPGLVLSDILSLGAWPFPSLAGVTEVPVMRADGSILDKPGYDPGTRLYYWQDSQFKMPRMTCQEAVDLLKYTITDFPFTTEASRTNTLALMLTPIVRPAIRGQVPLALLDAPQQGTGKSLLADVISLIATGRPSANMGAPYYEDEWRKKLTATFMSGATIITIDNLGTKLDSEHLARALTSPIWEDRILGVSEIVRIAPHVTWMATGNNIRLGGDMQRRCYWIRMDAESDHPWEGRTFREKDLKGFVESNRVRLIGALLTLASEWFRAGKPCEGVREIGGFEAWYRTVGGILQFAGVGGFLDNLQEMYSMADEDTEEWSSFLAKLREQFPDSFRVSDVIEALVCGTNLELPSDLSSQFEKPGFNQKLGHAFNARKDRRFDGLRLVKVGEIHKTAVWGVRA